MGLFFLFPQIKPPVVLETENFTGQSRKNHSRQVQL